MEQITLLEPSKRQHARNTDRQSLAVAQVFLNAAIACIAHTRELIPWVSACFQTRCIGQLRLDVEDQQHLYTNFCSGRLAESDTTKSQEFRVMRRGLDRRADRILDMIEGGVSDALHEGFLAALQVFVVADEKDPASILETYTFSFIYEENDVSHVNISSQGNNPFVVKNVHHSFTAAIKALLRSLKDLPQLPRRRSLGTSLLFHESCPRDYQPIGFIDARLYQQEPLRGCWTDMWQTQATTFATLSLPCLKVAMGKRYLEFDNNMSYSRLQDQKISRQLQVMQQTSSYNQHLTSTESVVHVSLTRVTASNENEKATMAPGASSQPGNSLAALSVASKNRRRRNVVASKLAELIVQARAMENNNLGHAPIFDDDHLGNGKVRRLNRCGLIRCECGSRHETLFCELCGTKQHRICYGYESLRQGCLPEEHFCYNCLLLPREDSVSRGMPGIVHMRLALLFLANQPSSTVRIGQNFIDAIFHVRENALFDFSRIVDRLTAEGYLSKRRNDVVQIVGGDKLSEAQALYLDPLAGIIHHYQIVRDGDTAEKRTAEVVRALKLYIKSLPLGSKDRSNSHYDRVHVINNRGEEVIRWGFYASWKRKDVNTVTSPALRRKMSISNRWVNVNRSTSSETMAKDDAMQEAMQEAKWDLCLCSRLNPVESTWC